MVHAGSRRMYLRLGNPTTRMDTGSGPTTAGPGILTIPGEMSSITMEAGMTMIIMDGSGYPVIRGVLRG
jgi:hypothetical protein